MDNPAAHMDGLDADLTAAAAKTIETMERVVEAARCIRHWHDTVNDGMIVSGEHVRALWQALADFDAVHNAI